MTLPKDFISVRDLDRAQIEELFRLASGLKQRPQDYRRRLDGQALALIFQKPSTRTRVSFDVGMGQLGGRALYMSRHDMQLGRGETVADTARVLSGYVDGVVARLFAHADVVEMAEAAAVPVINALTDDLHPCQALADYFTLGEIFGDLSSLKLAYIGDGNNVAQSLLVAAAVLGSSIAIATPSGYEVDPKYAAIADELARDSGAEILHTTDPLEAAAGSHAVYTDVWTSMGQEESSAQREIEFRGFEVDAGVMAAADASAIFLHCLPLHRGEEVSAEVADGSQSRIFVQAENRLHVQKALLLTLLDRDSAGAEGD